MPTTALVLYLVFVLTGFALRGVVQYRRTGSAGFLGMTGKPGSAESWGGVLFAAGVLLGLLGPSLQLAGVVSPLAEAAWLHVAGLLLAVAGIAGTLAAQHEMGASWRVGVDPGERTELVTTGMFALARNPIFTTTLTAALGLTLLALNPLSVLGLLALFTGVQLQVRLVEEPHLTAIHGSAYRTYAARVGRFLPIVGRLPDSR